MPSGHLPEEFLNWISEQKAVVGNLADYFHGQRIMNEVRADQVEFTEADFRVEISDGVD